MGQMMVAQVTMNRVESSRYPDTVCDVVYQRKQFSWTAAKGLKITEPRRMMEAVSLSWGVVTGETDLPGSSATHYHATSVSPSWAGRITKLGQVGSHIFYEE